LARTITAARLISDALTLLTNAVIAYNTWKLHRAVERRRVAD
jgi:TnpA family transposase